MKNPICLTPPVLQPLKAERPRQLTWLTGLAALDLTLSGVLVHIQGLSVGSMLGFCYSLFLGGAALLSLNLGSKPARVGVSLFYGIAALLSLYLLAALPWNPFFASYELLNLTLSGAVAALVWTSPVSAWLRKAGSHIQAMDGAGHHQLARAKVDLGLGLAVAGLMTLSMLVMGAPAALKAQPWLHLTAAPIFLAGMALMQLQLPTLRSRGDLPDQAPVSNALAPSAAPVASGAPRVKARKRNKR